MGIMVVTWRIILANSLVRVLGADHCDVTCVVHANYT